MSRAKVTNAQARTSALLMLGAGAYFLKFGYIDVLRDAERQAASAAASTKGIFEAPVSLMSTKVIVFAPAFLIIGLVLLVTGAPDASSAIGRLMARPEDGEIAPLGMGLVISTLLPGVALYMWRPHRLALLGFA